VFCSQRRHAAVCSLAALALFGCDDSSGGNTIAPPPTMVVVDPQQFDPSVACVDAPGAMRVYVATLFDVTGDYDAAVPALPSSPPTACTTPVGFGYVEPGRKYRAEIDGYDRSDLESLTPGNRLLQQRGTGQLVEPRWRASCGNPLPDGTSSNDGGDLSFLEGPAEAFLNWSVTVKGCTAFSDSTMTPLGSAIRIDLNQALGSLDCGTGPDQVASYEVTLRDGNVAPRSASCGDTLSFDNLDSGQTYFFDVLAFAGEASTVAASDGGPDDLDAAGSNGSNLIDASIDAASDAAPGSDSGSASAASSDAASPLAPSWRTTCYQRALQGVQQAAICEPLAPVL
jgi:hypothetical protein